jgi:hypothetical protein
MDNRMYTANGSLIPSPIALGYVLEKAAIGKTEEAS